MRTMKPILLVVIDALTARVVLPALECGQLPTLAALARAGTLRSNCISIFPSITPAATASIVTGCYPAEHGIAGAYWYDEAHDQVVYYSDDIWAILRQGLNNFVEDFLVKLNHERLRALTLLQEAERAGQRAASLNHLIFRGDVEHKVKPPLLLRMIPGVPPSTVVRGPSGLMLGDFVAAGLGEQVPSGATGIQDRFGFDDAHTAEVLLHLARTRTLPDLTVAYFPDNDFRNHEVGPQAALDAVVNVDSYLGQLVDLYGGVEPLLQELCIIIVGDHSHCAIVEGQQAGIALDELLHDCSIVATGTTWSDDDDTMICLNLRVAQIYLRQPEPQRVEQIATRLLHDPRIDQVMWKSSAVRGVPRRAYVVATHERGTLRFWPGASGAQTAHDVYGSAWSWTGDLAAVDGHVQDGLLTFTDYPNAFERIAGGLDHEGAGHVWVTAQPGYSFHLNDLSGREIHAGGGSHGALHVLDSCVPLFVAGAPEGVQVPTQPRTIDVAPLCRQVLGLPSEHAPGASRVLRP